MTSSFIKRHHQKFFISSVVASVLFATVALLLLLPPVQDMLMGAAALVKGRALRKPWKWQNLFHVVAYLSFLMSALFIALAYCLRHIEAVLEIVKRHGSLLQKTGMYLILFMLLVMHAPEDFFTPYLWCEDGSVLISGAVSNGIGLLFTVHNGVFWLAQKLLGLLCYWLVLPFNDIRALPYIQQTAAKLIEPLSVFYFVSDSFSWLVKERRHRFVVCVAVMLLMSPFDIIPCETSIPFFFIFTVFLVGLDLLFNPERKGILWKHVIFLMLFALSSAGAPMALFVAGLSFLRFLVRSLKAKSVGAKELSLETMKTVLVAVAVGIQLAVILTHGRTSTDLDLWNRLVLNTKNFMFIPYRSGTSSWSILFVIGLACWILYWRGGRIALPVLAYSWVFSWGMMLLSSMVESADFFYLKDGAARYFISSFEIAVFLLVVASIGIMLRGRGLHKMLLLLLFLTIPVDAYRNYKTFVPGADFADAYRRHSFVFDRKGSDTAVIPIGPWHYITMRIPARIETESAADDMDIMTETVNWDTENGTSSRTVSITGLVATVDGARALTALFLRNPADGRSFHAAYKISAVKDAPDEKRFFAFNLPPEYFTGGHTELELYGKAEDGSLHKGRVVLPGKTE